VWVLTDITERKQAERAFFSGLLKEQELNDRKTRLITNISHQFFTPLSVILSSAELIQHLGEKCTPEKRSQLLTRITQGVEQLTGMMHSHLQLEQRPLGERDAFSDGVDLSRTLICAIDDLAMGDKRWNTVVPRILGRGRLVRTSERLVRQLMVELLRNAGTYGGAFAGIKIDLDLDQEPFRFSVRDHGPGLPPAGSRPAVHRLSTSHGLGLGLAIVRECCQQLCGSFEIGNHPGGGVLAIATLPDANRGKEPDRR
jgi:signal transduction histidine kinase